MTTTLIITMLPTAVIHTQEEVLPTTTRTTDGPTLRPVTATGPTTIHTAGPPPDALPRILTTREIPTRGPLLTTMLAAQAPQEILTMMHTSVTLTRHHSKSYDDLVVTLRLIIVRLDRNG